MINRLINRILLIIDYKSLILIMLIILKEILFKHVTANNMEVTFLIIKWVEFHALTALIGLITSTDFNQLSIDLKLVIIDFRISVDSQT